MEPTGTRPIGKFRFRWKYQTMRDLSIVGGSTDIARDRQGGGELCGEVY